MDGPTPESPQGQKKFFNELLSLGMAMILGCVRLRHPQNTVVPQIYSRY